MFVFTIAKVCTSVNKLIDPSDLGDGWLLMAPSKRMVKDEVMQRRRLGNGFGNSLLLESFVASRDSWDVPRASTEERTVET